MECEIMKTIKQEWQEEWLPEIKKALQDLKSPKTLYKQIPNLLTASRLLSPLIIIPVALTMNVTTTFVVAGLFALTDTFDGFIARKYNLKSKLGAMLDPVTDKLFALGLLIPNIAAFPFISTIFIGLEAVIAKINSTSKLKGNLPKSNMLGKTKTTFLSITAIAMYLSGISWIKNIILPILSVMTITLQTSAAVVYKKIDMEKDQKKLGNQNQSSISITPSIDTSPDLLSSISIQHQDLKEELIKEKESLLNQKTLAEEKQLKK